MSHPLSSNHHDLDSDEMTPTSIALLSIPHSVVSCTESCERGGPYPLTPLLRAPTVVHAEPHSVTPSPLTSTRTVPYEISQGIYSDNTIGINHPAVLMYIDQVLRFSLLGVGALPYCEFPEVFALAAFSMFHWDSIYSPVHWAFWGSRNVEDTKRRMIEAVGSSILPSWFHLVSDDARPKHEFNLLLDLTEIPNFHQRIARFPWFKRLHPGPLHRVRIPEPPPKTRRKRKAAEDDATTTPKKPRTSKRLQNKKVTVAAQASSPSVKGKSTTNIISPPNAPSTTCVEESAVKPTIPLRKRSPRSTAAKPAIVIVPITPSSEQGSIRSSPGSETAVEQMSPIEPKGTANVVEEVTDDTVVVPRRSTRAPKRKSDTVLDTPSSLAVALDDIEPLLKRKRGRPRKNPGAGDSHPVAA